MEQVGFWEATKYNNYHIMKLLCLIVFWVFNSVAFAVACYSLFWRKPLGWMAMLLLLGVWISYKYSKKH